MPQKLRTPGVDCRVPQRCPRAEDCMRHPPSGQGLGATPESRNPGRLARGPCSGSARSSLMGSRGRSVFKDPSSDLGFELVSVYSRLAWFAGIRCFS